MRVQWACIVLVKGWKTPTISMGCFTDLTDCSNLWRRRGWLCKARHRGYYSQHDVESQQQDHLIIGGLDRDCACCRKFKPRCFSWLRTIHRVRQYNILYLFIHRHCSGVSMLVIMDLVVFRIGYVGGWRLST